MVVGKLLDLDCPEDFVRNLLNQVGQMCPAEELVEQVPYVYSLCYLPENIALPDNDA